EAMRSTVCRSLELCQEHTHKPSRSSVAISFPEGERAAHRRSAARKQAFAVPCASQIRTVPSYPADAMVFPSALTDKQHKESPCRNRLVPKVQTGMTSAARSAGDRNGNKATRTNIESS